MISQFCRQDLSNLQEIIDRFYFLLDDSRLHFFNPSPITQLSFFASFSSYTRCVSLRILIRLLSLHTVFSITQSDHLITLYVFLAHGFRNTY
jgi:hypothetical protein